MAAPGAGFSLSQYPTAMSAPPAVQDAAALWLLENYGPNQTITWAASAPPGGYPDPNAPINYGTGDVPLLDTTTNADMSTGSLLSDIENYNITVGGVTITGPDLALGIGAIVAALLFAA